MTVSRSHLENYAKYLTQDEDCMLEVQRRMSMRYYGEFTRTGKDDKCEREQLWLKQSLLADFFKELKVIVAETYKIDQGEVGDDGK